MMSVFALSPWSTPFVTLGAHVAVEKRHVIEHGGLATDAYSEPRLPAGVEFRRTK